MLLSTVVNRLRAIALRRVQCAGVGWASKWLCLHAWQIIAVVSLGAPVLCFAGRPVVHDISLYELTHTSKLIVVATTATTNSTVKGEYGCDSLEWNLSVVAMIKTSPAVNIKAGNTIAVRQNVTAYKDCVLRQGGKTTGASFMATQYNPSVPDAPRQQRFIVFLEPSGNSYQLTAQSGYESIAKRPEVERLLNQQPTAVQFGAPVD